MVRLTTVMFRAADVLMLVAYSIYTEQSHTIRTHKLPSKRSTLFSLLSLLFNPHVKLKTSRMSHPIATLLKDTDAQKHFEFCFFMDSITLN